MAVETAENIRTSAELMDQTDEADFILYVADSKKL